MQTTIPNPPLSEVKIAVMTAPKRRPRRAAKIALSLVVLLVVAFLADSLIAARTERRISSLLYEGSNLPNPPSVQVTGFPYVAAAVTHELPSLTVTATDVDIPGWGLVSVQSSAQYVTVSKDDVFTGQIDNAPARKVFTRLQLDGVTIGDRMKISDLLIQNRDDMSPRGGWETEAIFEGTPRGFTKPFTVEMRLRVRESQVLISPVRIIKGPEGKGKEGDTVVDGADLSPEVTKEILDTFALKLAPSALPLPGKPMRVYVAGGSVFIESEQYYTSINIQDLAPYTRPLPEDEEPGL